MAAEEAACARWEPSSGSASAVANEPKSRVERPSLEARLRRCERAFRTSRRVHCQCDGALQERGRRGDSAASLCPASRTLEFGGDFLARSGRCSGAMPGAPIRIRLEVGRFGEGAMDAMAILGSGRAVGGGPDEWMRELDAPTYFEQTRVHRRVGRSHVDAERLGGTVEQQRVAERLCGRGEDEQLRLGREVGGAAEHSSVRSCSPPVGCRATRTHRRDLRRSSCAATQGARADCRGSQ